MQTIDSLLFVQNRENRLFYKKVPGGKKSLILFHGFGQDHTLFQPWFSRLSEQFTVYSVDVFFHGKSSRPNKPLVKNEWKQIFTVFLEKENIDHFSLGGYSLGGRFVFASALSFPSRVDHVILIAPDGIYRSFWYNFATFPLFQGLFNYLMRHPAIFGNWLNFFERNQLANDSLVRFARRELGPKENRIRVYQSWVYLKPLKFPKKRIRETFRKYKFKTFLIQGSKDNIVPPDKINPVFEGLDSVRAITGEKKHHELIDYDNLEILMKHFR